MQPTRYHVTDILSGDRRDFATCIFPLRKIPGGTFCGLRRLMHHIVGKIVHMQTVACRKDAIDAGHVVFIDTRPFDMRIHFDAAGVAKMILRNQSARQQQRIDVKVHFAALDGLAVRPDFAELNALQTLMTVDVGHGMRKVERNIEILQALLHVAGKAVGIRHQLCYAENLCAFQRHAPRHDQTDVS